MLFADDIMSTGESPEEVNGILEEGRETLKSERLNITGSKTV